MVLFVQHFMGERFEKQFKKSFKDKHYLPEYQIKNLKYYRACMLPGDWPNSSRGRSRWFVHILAENLLEPDDDNVET